MKLEKVLPRAASVIDDAMKRRQDPWNFLFIAGMWFQDLFNYDFRRTEMCIIPYATQQGEISFCAYNTGIGWRKILENMYKNSTVAAWYKTHGKHEIYARGKKVDLDTYEHNLKIDAGDAARVRVHDADDVPETAAQEDRIRRKEAWQEAAKVRAIYEELVLKKAQPEVVQIGSIDSLKAARPGSAPVTISGVMVAGSGNGNGHSNGNGHEISAEKAPLAEPVAGD